MSLHYHGCPITPRETLLKLAGCCFCVRYGEHRDVAVAHEIGQSVMLDNGAFPACKASGLCNKHYQRANPYQRRPLRGVHTVKGRRS